MGDSGSLFVGLFTYVVCIYMIQSKFIRYLGIFILNAVFFIDSTFTVLKRLLERKNIFVAHNEHFYQQYIREKYNKFKTKYDMFKVERKLTLVF